ncbi:uncharacterized protein LOC130985327 [Salvia miltiorrhiza]|uniref:uncharacterized protein LOC130985327 n=1 Tax=Salvia miltiorrhiza TaxID=226208 RepID=UPI0025AC44D3|nr:uncharacterized protein LOC130985327 [Salvia miltiorrhiza]
MVMSEGSWTRESVFHTCGVWKPLWFLQNGELLYFASLNDELAVFDHAIGKLKHLGMYCFSTSPRLILFFESFVQLNGISDVEEEKEEDEHMTEGEGPLSVACYLYCLSGNLSVFSVGNNLLFQEISHKIFFPTVLIFPRNPSIILTAIRQKSGKDICRQRDALSYVELRRCYKLRWLSGSYRPCKEGTGDVRVVDFCTRRPCPSTIVMSTDAFAAVSRSLYFFHFLFT